MLVLEDGERGGLREGLSGRVILWKVSQKPLVLMRDWVLSVVVNIVPRGQVEADHRLFWV
jgi:hypothetical protein